MEVARAPLPSVVVVAVLCPPGVALAQWTFESAATYEPCGEPFTWDFAPLDAEADGRLVDGTCDAFDGCMLLFVDDEPFPATSYHSAADGRGFVTDEEPVSGVNVQRSSHVPATGTPFARFVDVFANPAGSPVDVTVRYRCNLGSDGEETGYGADGDSVPEVTDTWIASDDADAAEDPSLAFVVQGPGASVGLGRWVSTPGTGSIDFEFSLSLDALERSALMVFVVQAADRASSYEAATWLESMPEEAIASLDEGALDEIENFVAGGVPSLAMGGPYFAPEGGTIELVASAFDSDGDPLEVAWDLNGDGTYETAGDRAVLDATRVDGPADPPLDVGVQATDGTYTIERRGVVEVVNVAPVLAVLPDPDAVVGFEWVQRLAVVDPSPDDEVFFELLSAPTGMVLDGTGTLHWTPLEERDELVRVRLSDHEEAGERIEEIPVTARVDAAPGTPRLVSPDDGAAVGITRPSFTFGSVSDPDGDPIRYTVTVAMTSGQEPCDDGEESIASDPLVADVSGNTTWQSEAQRLCRARTYAWSVTASDGFLVSDHEERTFTVDRDAVDELGGEGDPGAGCACESARGSSGPGLAMATLISISLAAGRRARRFGTSTHGRRE